MSLRARSLIAVAASWGVVFALAGGVFAQGGPGGVAPEPRMPSGERPNLLKDVAYTQQLDALVPGDLVFRDADGRAAPLSQYLGKRPVILALVYYECPMLCTQVLSGLVTALDLMTLQAGRDFDVVAVSFNPKEGPGLASAKRRAFVERYDRPGADTGIHFLTGPEPAIAQLTKTVGFSYRWDDTIKQFAHAAGVVVLTPEGRVSKYYYGVEYSPRDLRLGLVDASNRKIGSFVDELLLYCYHYDPTTGKYGMVAMTAVRIGGVLTIGAMVSVWLGMWFKHRRVPHLPPAVRRA